MERKAVDSSESVLESVTVVSHEKLCFSLTRTTLAPFSSPRTTAAGSAVLRTLKPQLGYQETPLQYCEREHEEARATWNELKRQDAIGLVQPRCQASLQVLIEVLTKYGHAETAGNVVPENQLFENESAFSFLKLTRTQRLYGFIGWYKLSGVHRG